jgi:7,8-dihydroneopterin aldolase/epimerase/oxygenase
MKYEVQLQHVQLWGYHGLYEGEGAAGGAFEININCMFERNPGALALSDTVNYADVYLRVKQLFEQRYELLETLAGDIIDDLKSAYPFLREILVSVDKLNPPIPGFQGRVGVRLSRSFDT